MVGERGGQCVCGALQRQWDENMKDMMAISGQSKFWKENGRKQRFHC